MAKIQVSGWNEHLQEMLDKVGEYYRARGVNVAPPQNSRSDEISDAAVIRQLITDKYDEIKGGE